MWNDCIHMQNELVKMRRDLHQIPELGLFLPKTASYVISKLNEWKIPYEISDNDSNIIATIKGQTKKNIALRADMDGLPLLEKTGVKYSSIHDCCMHACGHDAHTAMLLGAAKILKAHQNELQGTVTLIFQAGEENFKGARAILDSGRFHDIDAIFGIHIGSILGPEYPTGSFIIPTGTCMAAFAHFKITVNGKGCHGATPEKGIDPINIASHIIIALQTITTRELNANKTLVITFGKIHGGNEHNIIPDTVTIEGTIRTLEQNVREYASQRIKEISDATAKMFGGSSKFEIDWGAYPLSNTPEMAKLAVTAAKRVLGNEKVITKLEVPNLCGEDFAYYLQNVPGTFMFLSSANANKHTDIPHHNSKFNIDEDVLWEGTAVFVSLVDEFFSKNK